MAHHLRIQRYHTGACEHYNERHERHANGYVSSRARLLPATDRRIRIERRMRADFTEHRLGLSREHEHAKEHAHARRAKAPVPANDLSQKSGYDLTGKRTEIYAHVKDRKPCVAPRSTFRIKLA